MRRGLLFAVIAAVCAAAACASFTSTPAEVADAGPQPTGTVDAGVVDAAIAPEGAAMDGATATLPALVHSSTWQSTSQSGALTFAAATKGDLLVLAVVSDDGDNAPKDLKSQDSPWTLLRSSNDQLSLTVWSLVASGGETMAHFTQIEDDVSVGLVTEWSGLAKALGSDSTSTDHGKVVAGPLVTTSGRVLALTFAGVEPSAQPLATSDPFNAFDTSALTYENATVVGGYQFFNDDQQHGASFTFAASAPNDAITQIFGVLQ